MQPEKSVRPGEQRGPEGRRRCRAQRSRLFSPIPLVITAVLLLLFTALAPLRPTLAAPYGQTSNLVIGYPPSGSTLSGVVTIQGNATAEGFENYSVYYAAGSEVHGGTSWRYDDPIIDFVPTMIVNGSLGQWDTTQVPNGQYVLALAVRTNSETLVAFVNNLTVYNEAATPTPEPTETPEVDDVEQTEPTEPEPEQELPPPVGATIELPPTATPRPTPTFTPEEAMGGTGTGGDDDGGLFSGDLFSVKAVREAFTIGVQLAFLAYAIGLLYVLTKAVIRYYLRQTRGKARP